LKSLIYFKIFVGTHRIELFSFIDQHEHKYERDNTCSRYWLMTEAIQFIWGRIKTNFKIINL